MSTIYNNAINAYKSASSIAGAQASGRAPIGGDQAVKSLVNPTAESGAAASAGNPLKPAFDQMVAESLNKSMATEYQGEETSIKTLVKKAELHEMVTAVTNAELTLKSVVAVRDKVIGAYQEILRMQI